MKHTIKDQEDKNICIEYIQSRPLGKTTKGEIKQHSFDCKPKKAGKTWSQVKLYFAWIRFVLMECGYSKGDANEISPEFHKDLKKIILGYEEKEVADKIYEIIPSIKPFDKDKMRIYMNDCKDYLEPKFEIRLPLPEDRWVDSFMEKYGLDN